MRSHVAVAVIFRFVPPATSTMRYGEGGRLNARDVSRNEAVAIKLRVWPRFRSAPV
jgi:hypothetical protein